MAPGTKRSGGVIFFVLALILVLLIAGVFFAVRFLNIPIPIAGLAPQAQTVENTPTPAPQTVKVAILTQAVNRGGVIKEEMVTLVEMPKTDYTEGVFFNDTKQVVDKKAKYALQPGTPLTPALLVDAKTGSTPAFDIPAGMVAIAVPISRLTSVAYALQPGDSVNVIVSFLITDLDPTFQSRLPNKAGTVVQPGTQPAATEGGGTGPTTITMTLTGSGSDVGRTEIDQTLNQPVYLVPSEPQRPRLISQTLIQGALVLWVGDFTPGAYEKGTPGEQPTPTPVPQGQETAAQGPQPYNPDIITLVVEPQDAVAINNILLQGAGAQLNLVLRSAGDTTIKETDAVTLQFLMDHYKVPLPAKVPYGIEPRQPDTGLTYPLP